MKKKLVAFVLMLSLVVTGLMVSPAKEVQAAATVKINSKNFPDAAFREYISSKFDKNGNGNLSEAELNNAKNFEIPSASTNITGIKLFPNVTKLSLDYCENIIAITVSDMPKLKSLTGNYSGLVSVNVSNCDNLEYMEIRDSRICCANVDLEDDVYVSFGKQETIELQAVESNGKYKLDLNIIPGFDYKKAEFNELYLDGATVKKGVIKWNRKKDIPSKIKYTYDCGTYNYSTRSELINVEIKVKKPGTLIKKIKTKANKIVLNYGESYSLKATVSPSNASNKTLQYSMGTSKVETTKGVKINGTKPGTKYLYIKTLDGSNITKKIKVVVRTRKESKTATEWKNGTSTIYIHNYNSKKIKFEYMHANNSRGDKLAGFTKTVKLKKGKGTFIYTDDYGNKGKGTIWVKKNNVYLKCTQTKYNPYSNYGVGTFKTTKFKYAGVMK